MAHRYAPYERLTRPLVRERRRAAAGDVGRGAAPRRRRVPDDEDEAGPTAVGFFSCSKSTNEMNFIAQKFARAVIGTNNIDSCNRT